MINGQFTIENINLEPRDGLGITDTSIITIKSNSQDSEILLMEVPMKFWIQWLGEGPQLEQSPGHFSQI